MTASTGVATACDSQEALLADLLEQLADELRRTGAIDLAAWQARYPQLAGEIAELLPTVHTLVGFSGVSGGESSPPAEPLADRTLGDYRILREIGRGGMGVVYEAEQLSLGRRVALKVLPFAGLLDERTKTRFKNEARAAAALAHPHIVSVYACGEERGVYFYAMQLIRGQTLAEVVSEMRGQEPGARGQEVVSANPQSEIPNPQSPAPDTVRLGSTAPATRPTAAHFRRVAEIGAQVAEALDYAHQHGIVHRDIKPSNLLLDGEGRAWVTDFGLAAIDSAGQLTQTGDLLGTLRYMSPEQAAAERDILDHRTDIYSLGVTLYELLALQPAFGQTQRAALLAKVLHDDPPPLRRHDRRIPLELETIVQKAMSKEATDRYRTAGEVADELRRFLADQPIRASRPSLVRRLARWSRRHQRVVAVCAGLLLVAAAAGGWIARDRAVRIAQTTSGVQQALADAERLQALALARPYDPLAWSQVVTAVDRAEAIAAAGVTEPHVARRTISLARSLRRDAKMLHDLEDGRLLAATAIDESGRRFSKQLTIGAYRAAFHDFGIEIAAMSVEDAARRVRGESIREELIAALMDWSSLCIATESKSQPTADDLLRVAEAAADDRAWQRPFIDAVRRRDWAALQAIAERPASNQLPATITVQVGRHLLLGAHDAELAAAVLLRAIPDAPQDFWLNCVAGDALCGLSPPKYSEALRFYQAAVAVRPHSAGAHEVLAHTLSRSGQHAAAITEHRAALRLDPNMATARNNLGADLGTLGRKEEALAEYREAVRLQPSLAIARFNVAAELGRMGRHEAAIAEFREALRIDPLDATTHTNLGLQLHALGRFDEAALAHQEAIRVEAGNAAAHSNLGNALEKQNRLQAAIEAHRTAIRLEPDVAAFHFNLANVLSRLGQWEEAVTEYKEANRLRPGDVDYHFNLAAALMGCGLLKQAEQELQTAIDVDPQFANAYSRWGDLHVAQGKPDAAIARYREALEQDPNCLSARHSLAQQLQNKGLLAEAQAELEEAIRRTPRQGIPRYTLANLLARQGRWDEAIAAYRETIDVAPDLAEAHCNLGNALKHTGQFQAALDAYQRGHELGSRRTNWGHPSAQWVAESQQLVQLEAAVDAALRGEGEPQTAEQQLEWANFLMSRCARPVIAAAWFRSAFQNDPKLYTVERGNRFHAARAAVLAASGDERSPLADSTAEQWRQQALQWLTADVRDLESVLGGSKQDLKVAAKGALQMIQSAPALASVREAAGLEKLPADERERWEAMWAEVRRLLKP